MDVAGLEPAAGWSSAICSPPELHILIKRRDDMLLNVFSLFKYCFSISLLNVLKYEIQNNSNYSEIANQSFLII